MGYKFRLMSNANLIKRINDEAGDLNAIFELINELHDKIAEQFEQLKKIKPKLTKLAIQVAKIKEEKPVLKDLYEKNEQKVSVIEKDLASDIEKLLGLISKAARLMRGVIFDADTILYREDRQLSKLIKKAKAMRDMDLVNKIVFKLNTAKADMKSLTLRLLQASELEEEEVLRYPAKRFEVEVSGIRAPRITGEEIEEIGVQRIDAVIKKSMRRLKNLRAIELRVILLMSSIDRHHDYIKSKAYLFEEDMRADISSRIDDSIRHFESVKKDIKEQALDLYEDIEIIGERK